jgi:hypothetical protein
VQAVKEERKKAAQELKRLEALQAEVAAAQAQAAEEKAHLEVSSLGCWHTW